MKRHREGRRSDGVDTGVFENEFNESLGHGEAILFLEKVTRVQAIFTAGLSMTFRAMHGRHTPGLGGEGPRNEANSDGCGQSPDCPETPFEGKDFRTGFHIRLCRRSREEAKSARDHFRLALKADVYLQEAAAEPNVKPGPKV
ncbi:MAG: hypothetical protein AAGF67_16665, partial [Verrucomicrobiota bacterium]